MDDLTAQAERFGIEPGYHDVFGGWQKAQKTHFNEGGVFDQIQKANR